MAFLRTKKIKGAKYCYLVENQWRKGTCKQRVKKYLGRVHDCQKSKDTSFYEFTGKTPEHYLEMTYGHILHDLLQWELFRHELSDEDYKRGVVFSMNKGYLCMATMARLQHFATSTQESAREVGERLATYLVDAGIEIPSDLFVILFHKIIPKNRVEEGT